jgi:FkbM family methyltransferase
MNLNKKKIKRIDLKLRKIGIPEEMVFYISEEDKGLSKDLEKNGWREPYNSKHIYNFVSTSDVVLDIGANLGYFTLLCKNAKRIISIEPIPQAIPIIKKNTKENSMEDKCEVLNYAVGKEGYLNLEINERMNLSKIVEKETEKSVKIKSKPLNYFVKKYNANFIRMDVEGYEYEILIGNIPKKIDKITLEFHLNRLGNKKYTELLEHFKEEGFKIRYFIPKTNKLNNFLICTKISSLFVPVKKEVSFNEIERLIKNRGGKILMKLYQKLTNKNLGACHLILERKQKSEYGN